MICSIDGFWARSSQRGLSTWQQFLKNVLSRRIFLYSFGSPRVGNRAFSDLFNIAVPRSFRVVLRNDVVTVRPPGLAICYHNSRRASSRISPDDLCLACARKFLE